MQNDNDILNSLRSVAKVIRELSSSGGSAVSPSDIRSIRTRLNMSQETMARKIGVSTDTVRSWELGRRKPGLLALVSLVELEEIEKNLQLENA